VTNGTEPDDAPLARPGLGAWSLALVQGTALATFGGLVAASTRRRGAALVGVATTAAVVAPYVAAVARHRPYATDLTGLTRWAVDSTWSAPNTLAGALFFAHQRGRGNAIRPERTTGSGTVDLSRAAIAGYATTVGVVVAGSRPRLDAHEQVHVTQQRVLGPLYGPLVVADYARLICAPTWWRHHDHDGAPIVSLATYLQRGVYRRVWHERWAYAVAPAGSPLLTVRQTVEPVVRRLTAWGR
jgi:hypothetical protein